MEALKNLSGTTKILIGLGVFGIPFCTYVLYQDFIAEPEPQAELQASNANSQPSLLLPTVSGDEADQSNEVSKVEVYEETLDAQERAKKAAKQVDDPFKEIMDDNFFSTEEKKVEQEGGEDIESRYSEWIAEKETEETDHEALTTRQTKERVRVTIQETSKPDPEQEPKKTQEETHEFSFYSKRSSNEGETDLASDTETIKALVHNEQVVTNNSSLRVRILQDVIIGGVEIPKNSIIWGNVSFGRDRVRVSFLNVDIGGRIISFSKEAYGKDGMKGIPLSEIPGAENLIQDARDDRISDLESRRGVVGDIASGLDALADNTTKITFRDGHPFYLR